MALAADQTSGVQRERVGAVDTGAFAFVMATGIVSVAAFVEDLALLSDVLLAVACASWAAPAAVLSWPPRRSSQGRPRLQSFALVAATAVIAVRFSLAGHGAIALGLWGVAVCSWLLLVLRPPFISQFVAHRATPATPIGRGRWRRH